MKKLPAALICLLTLAITGYAQSEQQERKNLEWDTLTYPKGEYGWSEGMIVPDVTLLDVNNQEMKLYDLLDKPVVIDFWFMTCKPCIANKKYLKRFYRQYPIEILSISVDKVASDVKRYAQENGMYWKNVHDNNAFKERFKLQIGSDHVYPFYLLIGKDKRVVGVYPGGNGISGLGVALQELADHN